jgi:hypothetical protein
MVLFILLLLIILSIIYLCYREYQYKELIDKFQNRNSLSVYYNNDINSDELENNKNSFNVYYNKPQNLLKWNGIWVLDNIYAQFIQNNDLLMINFINSDYQKTLDESFQGIMNNYILLNIPNGTIYSINVKYLNDYSFELTIKRIDGEKSWSNELAIKIYDMDNINFKTYSLGSSNNIIKKYIINTNNLKILPQNTCPPNSFIGIGQLNENRNYFILKKIICNNYNNINLNLNIHQFAGFIYNNKIKLFSDGIPNNIILNKKEDLIFNSNDYPIRNTFIDKMMNNINNLPIIPKDQIKDNKIYMNYMNINGLLRNNGSTLNICEYLKYFTKCNSCIIGYIDKLGNVQTLNFQYFGINKKESNLILQYDVMNNMFNNENSNIDISKYRLSINNNDDNTKKAISLTSCISKNKIGDYAINIYNNCINSIKKYINDFEMIIENNIAPCVWQINKGISNNMLTYCPISINTFEGYSKVVKYVQYSGSDIYLTPIENGLNQQLLLEDITVLNYKENGANANFMLTANIKTLNDYYLVPSLEAGFSNNSNLVRLSPTINEYGKWIILGFTLNNVNELMNVLKNIEF